MRQWKTQMQTDSASLNMCRRRRQISHKAVKPMLPEKYMCLDLVMWKFLVLWREYLHTQMGTGISR